MDESGPGDETSGLDLIYEATFFSRRGSSVADNKNKKKLIVPSEVLRRIDNAAFVALRHPEGRDEPLYCTWAHQDADSARKWRRPRGSV